MAYLENDVRREAGIQSFDRLDVSRKFCFPQSNHNVGLPTGRVSRTRLRSHSTQVKVGASSRAVARYVSVVINDEWPIQRAGKTPDQGWKPLRELNTAIATIQPQNLGEAVIQAELLKTWNELYQTRSSRLSAVQGHVPGVVWWIVFFGAAITTGYTYFFGYQNFGMHVAMTGTLAATLALIVVLVVALDWPFRGEIGVTPDPFVMTQQSWSEVPFDKK